MSLKTVILSRLNGDQVGLLKLEDVPNVGDDIEISRLYGEEMERDYMFRVQRRKLKLMYGPVWYLTVTEL